jgi:hypothetical protein
MKKFTDTSIMQNVAEYADDRGDKWRVLRDQLTFQYFRLSGDAYIFYGSMPRCKGSIKSAHSKMVRK